MNWHCASSFPRAAQGVPKQCTNLCTDLPFLLCMLGLEEKWWSEACVHGARVKWEKSRAPYILLKCWLRKYVWPARVVTPYFLRPSGSMPSSPSQNKFSSVLHRRLNQSRRCGSKPNRSLNRRATKTTV